MCEVRNVDGVHFYRTSDAIWVWYFALDGATSLHLTETGSGWNSHLIEPKQIPQTLQRTEELTWANYESQYLHRTRYGTSCVDNTQRIRWISTTVTHRRTIRYNKIHLHWCPSFLTVPVFRSSILPVFCGSWVDNCSLTFSTSSEWTLS